MNLAISVPVRTIAFSLALILTMTHADLSAQDRWTLLDLPFESGFSSNVEWPDPESSLFWRDSSIGYYYTHAEKSVRRDLEYYMTEDGGATWSVLQNPHPIPHLLLNEEFGFSHDGFATYDGGDSWEKITAKYTDTNYFPDPALKYAVTSSYAATPDVWTVLYQLHDADPGSTDSVPFGPTRIGYTSDGGSTWNYYDSLIYFGSVLQELHHETDFGFLPVPDGMTDTTSTNWHELLRMVNDSVALVSTRTFGVVETERRNYYYLGILNMKSANAVFKQMPFYEPIFPPPASKVRVEFLTDSIGFILRSEFVDIVNNPEDKDWTLYRTEDQGTSWEEIDVPSWIDYRSLRFVSTEHGIASNAVTYDGGRTWTAWYQPFTDDGLFYAIDSSHYALAGRYSLMALSSDAGRTWSRNEAGALPISVAAFNGNVLVGRNYQSLLVSPDSGETWTDVGVGAGLPASLSSVRALAFPDPEVDDNRMMGIANLIEYDGTTKVVAIESSDGGSTWSVGQDLTEMLGASGPMQLHFVGDVDSEFGDRTGFIASDSGLLVSENLGLSWTVQSDQYAFERLAMLTPSEGVAVMEDGIYLTGDGGMTWDLADTRSATQSGILGAEAFIPKSYAALFTDPSSGLTDWSYEESRDEGDSWTERSGSGAERPMNIGAYWGDATNVHVVGRAGTIQHSPDSGSTFSLVNDSVPEFHANAGYVRAGKDLDNLYIVAPGNQAGRYFMHWDRPSSVPVAGADGRRVVLLALDASESETKISVRLEVQRPVDANFVLYNQIGESVWRSGDVRVYQSSHKTLALPSLPSGQYMLGIDWADGGRNVVPVRVVR